MVQLLKKAFKLKKDTDEKICVFSLNDDVLTLEITVEDIINNGFKIQLLERFGNKDATIRTFLVINDMYINPAIINHLHDEEGTIVYYFDGDQYNCVLFTDKDYIDCSNIVRQFGGEGNKNIASFSLTKNIFKYGSPNRV